MTVFDTFPEVNLGIKRYKRINKKSTDDVRVSNHTEIQTSKNKNEENLAFIFGCNLKKKKKKRK